MNAPKLSVECVSKGFGKGQSYLTVLKDINLSLQTNEFVSLVGASGCGKSTLLSLVSGLNGYEQGQILMDGDLVEGPGRDRGVVFQHYTLMPWLTAQKNVEFALEAAGYSPQDRRDIAREHLKLVDLADRADAFPKELSGGMKQRVAIARALSYKPELLLMDEPFGALDALTRRSMQDLLTRVWEKHKLTVLFVTHDIEEAVYLSDRVVIMGKNPGCISDQVSIDLARPRSPEVVGSPEFAALHWNILSQITADMEMN